MSDRISEPHLKILWGRSGNKCNICKSNLTEDSKAGEGFVVGEMAHIYGEKEGAPRYNKDFDKEERKSYKNRILLCPTHHTKIDSNEKDYPAELLLKIKQEHEEQVNNELTEEFSKITYAELETVVKYLAKTDTPSHEYDYKLIEPKKKIQKNSLSASTERLIQMGMTQVSLVQEYLNKHPDINFEVEFRDKFIQKYEELLEFGLEGDELFEGLVNYTGGSSSDPKIRAAAMVVVTYFFEKCDIFEK